MYSLSYRERRGKIETYFDRTAAEAWKRLTSDAPVSRIRATVRAGRDEMRAKLLSYLPDDLSGRRILDAGCGTGALALDAARRGADVIAIDIAQTLVELAQSRAADFADEPGFGRVEYMVGDMLDPALGPFDHIIAMDSLIHYQTHDMVNMLAALTERCTHSLAFTFAPSTVFLETFIAAGRLFPQKDRAPWIVPVKNVRLRREISQHRALSEWESRRSHRVSSGFYTSEAMEIVRR